MFTELYREEKREEGARGGQEDKRGERKGERQIQPVISSPRDLPDPGTEPGSPALQVESLSAELPRKTSFQSTLHFNKEKHPSQHPELYRIMYQQLFIIILFKSSNFFPKCNLVSMTIVMSYYWKQTLPQSVNKGQLWQS